MSINMNRSNVTTEGILQGTIGIGQYIVNDYVLTLEPLETGDGYTLTIRKGSDVQTVTLEGLSEENLEIFREYVAAAQAAQLAAEGAQTAAETAQGNAEDAQDAAEAAQSLAETAQAAAETAETNAGASATQAGTSASSAAQSATQAAGSAAAAAQTLTDVQAAGQAQIAAIGAEGERVLGTIPEDYTELSGDVGDLKTHKVDKDALDNAGITARAYTTLFGGEFTVTTAEETGYENPRATYNVSSPSFSVNKNYRVTVNGASIILPGRLWKKVDYENGNYVTYRYIGNIAVRSPEFTSILNESNVVFCINCLENALEISTTQAGSYTILIEQIAETYTKLPNQLIYGSAKQLIESDIGNELTKISFPGQNDMSGRGAIAIGDCNVVSGDYGLVVGANSNVSAREGIVIGFYNVSSGPYSICIGLRNVASYDQSIAIGYQNTSSGLASFAAGMGTTASGATSHAEGNNTKATGGNSHAEGSGTTASGAMGSHAEGFNSKASGMMSHAEGGVTTASGLGSHAEGQSNTASGANAHAEGNTTTASGSQSHSAGNGTIANHLAQLAYGQYNVADASNAAATARGTYVEIVGNGTADNARSNARTLDWSGNEELAGSITLGKGTADEVTLSAAQLKQLLALLN